MKTWRESATLIVAARHTLKYLHSSLPSNFQYNYNLLCLKRHQNSTFMPNTYVFPGGVVHPSDADLKWHKLFSTFGFDVNSFASLTPKTNIRPPIFTPRPNELPREVSLRITAIRETFEECGILICKQSQGNVDRIDWAPHIEFSHSELSHWQQKVHNDATEFYTLCENFKCYPDLWALYEWSNWLSPTYVIGRRYNTVFYLVCLPIMPHAFLEVTEMEDLKWDVPRNFLYPSTDIILPPPQQYEIARIAKFENINNLLDFAIDKNKMGVLLNLPVQVELRDGKVHLLPGDSMYPKHADLVDEQIIDKHDITIREFRDISPIKNRMEFFNLQLKELFVQNFDSAGHLAPIQFKNFQAATIDKKSNL